MVKHNFGTRIGDDDGDVQNRGGGGGLCPAASGGRAGLDAVDDAASGK